MSGRNANGEGSLYHRTDGRWEAAVYVTTTLGTRKRLRVYGSTRQQAHDHLMAAKQREQQGIPTPERTWLLGPYLDYWLEHIVKAHRRPATYELYEMVARRYLKPTLGTTPLAKLSVQKVQQLINQLSDGGRSNRQVQIIRTVLSAALTRAVREELVTRNVARLVEVPSWQRADVAPWSADEARRFLTAAKASSYYPAFVLLLVYGLRRGEVLGLRWQDIDERAEVIRVRQQLQRLSDGLHLGPVKTAAGSRALPLVGLAARVLTDHREQRGDLTACAPWPADLVFISSSGSPIEPKNLVRSFHAISDQIGLRRIKLHHLRHTTATLLKNAGVPARDAQLILGHSQISITQQIYQHDDMGTRRESVGQIEKVFLRTANGSRCRQKLPSTRPVVALFTSFLSGGSSGARTHDTLLKSPLEANFSRRLTSVDETVRWRERLWKTGSAAVSVSVKSTDSSTQPPAPLTPPSDLSKELAQWLV